MDVDWTDHPVFEPGGLEVRAGSPPETILVGPRVGIDYAAPEDRYAPWRFAVGGTRWVSHRRTLVPEGS
ncbi:MAG: 3-methyladenine DNA glycosylase, partial [Myxococcota bacterium]